MSMKFKVGDRVRYVGNAYVDIGDGVVKGADEYPGRFYPYEVRFDYRPEELLVCSENELELENK